MSERTPYSEPEKDERVETPDVVQLHEGEINEPLSLWLLVTIMVFMFFGGIFLWSNSGGFSSEVYDTDQLSWVGGEAAAAGADPKVLGKRIFTQYCGVCHQPNGQGQPGVFPSLVESEWVLGKEWHGDNHLVKIVLNGLQGPITVKGQQYNNAMAPWGAVLKDDQIAAVLTYIRSEWGNDAPPISPEFVAKVRAENADRSTPWTQPELQGIGKVMDEGAADGGKEGEEKKDGAEKAPKEGEATPAPTPEATP